MAKSSAFDLSKCARPNILALEPYRCARDDYKDDGTNILLDANENAYGPALDLTNGAVNAHADDSTAHLHRYPDPMYAVSAQVNDLAIVKVPLDTTRNFKLRPEAINGALSSDPSIKIVYICSPGNPTANLIAKSDIQQVLEHATWNGVVVLDEAYIDFSPEGSSLAEWVTEWPYLVVMQTLSKAFGLAGIRLGAAFTSPEIARLLNNLKAPYNISSPTSALACAALQPENLAVMRGNRERIVEQRNRMMRELPKIPGVGDFLGGAESNFLLAEILDKPRSRGGKPSNETALAVYERLAETKGIVVRFRGKEIGCQGCIRITVGSEAEVDKLLREMRSVLGDIFNDRSIGEAEDVKEQDANDIVA